ncbi:MAG: hypothetical protein IJW21_04910 [Clostridia bacterium]|nr:hypothetical protein [Clostridia bacterium]
MQYTHNEAILETRKISKEDVTVHYRLFESSSDYRASYSVLISMTCESGEEEDYYIPDLAGNRMGALVLFDKLCRNAVLPCEVEEIYSDGFSEIL